MSLVLVAEKISSAGLDMLREAGHDVVDLSGTSREELLAALKDADALLVRSATKVDAALLAAAPKLTVVGRAGVGVDNVDVPAASARGVLVLNSPTGNVVSAVEHTVALLFALDLQLEHILAETMEGRWARHDAMRRRVETWVEERGHACVAPEGARSWTVSCVKPRPGLSSETLVAKAKERGYTIGGGYGKWKATTFRIGHMGDVDLASLEALLGVLDTSAGEAAA